MANMFFVAIQNFLETLLPSILDIFDDYIRFVKVRAIWSFLLTATPKNKVLGVFLFKPWIRLSLNLPQY